MNLLHAPIPDSHGTVIGDMQIEYTKILSFTMAFAVVAFPLLHRPRPVFFVPGDR